MQTVAEYIIYSIYKQWYSIFNIQYTNEIQRLIIVVHNKDMHQLIQLIDNQNVMYLQKHNLILAIVRIFTFKDI